jgi:hypothetical protein
VIGICMTGFDPAEAVHAAHVIDTDVTTLLDERGAS